MLTFLPKHVLALLGVLLQALNIIISGCYIFILAPFKLLPGKRTQRFIAQLLRFTPTLWSTINRFILYLCTKIEWDIQIPEQFFKRESCVLICNHQSWSDILINQNIFYRKLPPAMYFLKQELMWVPILGWGCWILEFPFMRRYSKKYLSQHPEKRGYDIESTRAACKRYQEFPVMIANYPEGTRFTKAKHDAQQSPYQHLLKPRAGGVAFVLQAMQEQIKYMVNVTIIYPKNNTSFWSFLGGAIKKITVHAEIIPVTPDLIGDYINDDKFREYFQTWFNELWLEKDKLINEKHELTSCFSCK